MRYSMRIILEILTALPSLRTADDASFATSNGYPVTHLVASQAAHAPTI